MIDGDERAIGFNTSRLYSSSLALAAYGTFQYGTGHRGLKIPRELIGIPLSLASLNLYISKRHKPSTVNADRQGKASRHQGIKAFDEYSMRQSILDYSIIVAKFQ